jgi:Ni,Fe-hydrogenase I large subunit
MYEKETAILDSTKIVLQVKLNELKKSEQSIQNLQFEKFETYNSFLKSNVKDTIGKTEGNALQLFVKSGGTISEFNKSKNELIKQTETSIVQIQKLSSDLKESNVQNNVALSYYSSEKGHADELIKTIEQNVKALNLSINNYRNSIAKTEEYIKHINSGQLPSVVADSTLE